MRATIASALVPISVLALLLWCSAASAQVEFGGLRLEGDVEAGVQFFVDEPDQDRKAKLEEYRDIPEGPFLERLQLRIFRPDETYSFEFGGSKWGQEDQEFSLRSGRLGLWEFGFEWDQMRHIFSTNARMLSTEAERGVFTLPSPRPALSTHNGGRELDEISTRWDTARIFLKLTPTPDLELRAEYTRIHKDGDRPLGMAFGSPGNNFLEVLEPIEQTIHDFRLRGTLARERWQLQFGYTLSIFQNSLNRLIADNPCFANAASCGGSDGGLAAPATGQVSLPPDNMAHTFTLAGGVNLPVRTRLTANLSYSLRLQNETFLPHTINSAVTSPALALPQDSLDGRVGVLLLNLFATSRPLRPLTLSMKYRLFDYEDMSDEIVFPGHVVNDRSLVVEDRRAGRFEYTRHNLDLDARLRLIQPVAFTLGAGWERWDRNEHREVPTSDEIFGKAALDLTPVDWLSAKLTYRPSFRRISEYNTFAHLEHTVVEEEAASAAPQSQSVLLRKFDEGERDRQRIDALIQLFPVETFTAALTGGWRNDDFIESPLGLQEATTWTGGFDLNWTPLERLALFAGYTREWIRQRMRSRNRDRTFTVPATVFDFEDHDWISEHTDTIDTIRLGGTVGLIPRRLDWTVEGSYAQARGAVDMENPTTPTSGTATQNANATVRPWPTIEDALLRVETALRYRFWKVWTAKLGYAFESFRKDDFRTEGLNPFVPGSTSIWLGNDTENYTAHIVSFTVGYRF